MVLESKVKGPKRLGQGARALGKKKHHQTIDSEDVDEQSGMRTLHTDMLETVLCIVEIITDASGVPIDAQSVCVLSDKDPEENDRSYS